jgi:phosphatidate cytidylyltransferase
VEGLIGGLLVAVLSSLFFTGLLSANWLKTTLLATWISVCAFMGDAAKSYVKRKYNVKDFSNLIPGHGGFLDRFDSLITAGAGVALAGWIVDL